MLQNVFPWGDKLQTDLAFNIEIVMIFKCRYNGEYFYFNITYILNN